MNRITLGSILGLILISLFNLGLAGYIVLSIANYATNSKIPTFELATVSAIIGGLLFSSGFTGIIRVRPEIQNRVRRISLLYLVATLSFVFLTLYLTLAQVNYSDELSKIIVLSANSVGILASLVSFSWANTELILLIPQLWIDRNISQIEPQIDQPCNKIIGAWQKCSFAGLEVVAYPESRRGLYYTDEFIRVTFELTNTTKKRLKGSVLFFLGLGPSGTEAKTYESVSFDLQPQGSMNDNDKTSIIALERLIGVQGNCIIGWLLPEIDRDAIESETSKEIVLKRPSGSLSRFETLYAFASYNRELFHRVYHSQESLMRSARNLTIGVIVLASITVVASFIQILISLNIIHH
jgi:hypothetical protein